MPSLKCEQCGKIKRCAMHLDEHTKRPVYLCPPCAKELGYAPRVNKLTLALVTA